VTRVHADESGRLVLEFETEARFPGRFVLQHAALPGAHAQVLPPASVPSPFALRAAPRAAHRPARQAWTAHSAFSLQVLASSLAPGETNAWMLPDTALILGCLV
ncbi:Protein of unknown function, partial [Gryllus bimaculatus]